jgi:hypothetical protein
MKKLLLTLTAAILSMSFMSNAFAAHHHYNDDDEDDDSTSSLRNTNGGGAGATGWFGEIGLGSANSSALNAGVNNQWAGRLDVGYKFSPYMGFVAGMTGLTNPTAGAMQASGQIYDASFQATIPFGKHFNLHGQAGLAYEYLGSSALNGAVVKASDGSGKVMFGVGSDVFLTKSFALTANDYIYMGADDGSPSSGAFGNTNIFMGGVKYAF